MTEREFREPGFAEPGQSPAERMEKRLASREIGRALRAVQAVRVLFITLAVVGGLWTLVALAADRGPDPVMTAIGIGGLSLAGLGIWRVGREPRLWAILVAVLQTLMAGAFASTLDFNIIRVVFSIPALFLVVVAVCAWGAVAVIAPAAQLIRENPNLRITKKLAGRRYRRDRQERGKPPPRPR
jgi:hypothetical protein